MAFESLIRLNRTQRPFFCSHRNLNWVHYKARALIIFFPNYPLLTSTDSISIQTDMISSWTELITQTFDLKPLSSLEIDL